MGLVFSFNQTNIVIYLKLEEATDLYCFESRIEISILHVSICNGGGTTFLCVLYWTLCYTSCR